MQRPFVVVIALAAFGVWTARAARLKRKRLTHVEAPKPMDTWVEPDETKRIAGIPVHNYDFAHEARLNDIVNREALNRSWIVMLKRQASDRRISSLCASFSAAHNCTMTGHPANGGIPFLAVYGSEVDLRTMLEHSAEDVEFVEPDLPLYEIPDMPNSPARLNVVFRYLPKQLRGYPVLFDEGGSTWLVSNHELYWDWDSPGLQYRASKRYKDIDGEIATWGTRVVGSDEGDGWVRVEVEHETPWGLDRVGVPHRAHGGYGIHVYVLDTGVRTTHSDFGGRAIPTLDMTYGWPEECHGEPWCADDRRGHGTHCAGTIGGTMYGVAPEATIHAVKVLNDQGRGARSWTIEALDWILLHGERPAVVSMSLGGASASRAYELAIDQLTHDGITVVVAAGNNNQNACRYSPAFSASAITVGAIDSNDERAGYSNYGKCVDIFAPGSDVKSLGHRSDSATAIKTGTSMACPHVSGAAALLLETNPGLDGYEVKQRLIETAQKDAIADLLSRDPNLLVWVGAEAAPVPAPAPPCSEILHSHCEEPAFVMHSDYWVDFDHKVLEVGAKVRLGSSDIYVDIPSELQGATHFPYDVPYDGGLPSGQVFVTAMEDGALYIWSDPMRDGGLRIFHWPTAGTVKWKRPGSRLYPPIYGDSIVYKKAMKMGEQLVIPMKREMFGGIFYKRSKE